MNRHRVKRNSKASRRPPDQRDAMNIPENSEEIPLKDIRSGFHGVTSSSMLPKRSWKGTVKLIFKTTIRILTTPFSIIPGGLFSSPPESFSFFMKVLLTALFFPFLWVFVFGLIIWGVNLVIVAVLTLYLAFCFFRFTIS